MCTRCACDGPELADRLLDIAVCCSLSKLMGFGSQVGRDGLDWRLFICDFLAIGGRDFRG